MSRSPRIVIAAGGTAGHVVPALAVAGALRRAGADVVFIGADRAEATLVPAAGLELHRLSVRGIDRRHPVRAAGALARAAAGAVRAWSLLGHLDPDAVLGGGGYVAGVVGAAAVARRVPLVLTEADSHLGLSNRALARAARRVCLAFPLDGRDAPRFRVTGRPVPAPFTDRRAARDALGVADDEQLVLVFGGSLGARSINRAAMQAYAEAPFRVLHVTGRRDHAELAQRPRRPGYDLREYLALDAFARALAASDLVVARAGGSIFEVAAHGRPAILIPFPAATADHQAANARWMEQAGAAVVVDDGELTPPRLAAETSALLGDPGRLTAMARASASLARPRAAEEIAHEVLAAAGEPR